MNWPRGRVGPQGTARRSLQVGCELCPITGRQMSAAGPGIRRGVRRGIGPGPGLGDPGQDVVVDLDWFLQMQEMAGVFDHDHE